MSEGVPHPSALQKAIESKSRSITSLSITCHRLASMVESNETNTFPLNVWDWRTENCSSCVGCPSGSFMTLMGLPSQEDSSFGFGNFDFLDDYRLAITSWRSGFSELLLLNKEQVPPMGPALTRFCGPASSGQWDCLFGASKYC